jgi:hypothetical protein
MDELLARIAREKAQLAALTRRPEETVAFGQLG